MELPACKPAALKPMRWSHFVQSMVAASVFSLAVSHTAAQDLSRVPGVVIDYIQAPSRNIFTGNPINTRYIGSPSITMTASGDYIATHDIFGSAVADNQTRVFRSIDKGETWTLQSSITGAFWSTVFHHNGAIYLMGPSAGSNGDMVIRRSTDNGLTWTSPADSTSGLLAVGNFGGTPNTPVIHHGRIWLAEGRRVWSAPVGSNLLLAASWTPSNIASAEANPQGSIVTTEGQVVASPDQGVVILPKINQYPNTALIRVSANPATVISPSAQDFVSLPGGEKKFAATYDSMSEKFYVLSNPVLPAHAGVTTPNLTRTTGAMLSSKDLIHWDVEKLFLFTPHIDNSSYGEGFQYFNFIVDGNRLAVVSRTAIDTDGDASMSGQRLPPRGHDSNLMTFHTIENFRTASPDQYLVVQTGSQQVLRYERTPYADAPLGSFALGANFAGAPLQNPNGVGQAASGDVYIREQGGRILHFDPLGNFIGTVASAPVPFQSQIDIAQAAPGQRGWIKSNSGTWDDPTHWHYWGRPDTRDEVANFGTAIAAPATVTLDQSRTVKGVRFRSSHAYMLAGSGLLNLEAATGSAELASLQGHHTVNVPVRLHSDTKAFAESGASLRFQAGLDINGKTLEAHGLGRFHAEGSFSMGGGRLVLDSASPFTFGSASAPTLDGTLRFAPAAGFAPTFGTSIELIEGVGHLQGEKFHHLRLPYVGIDARWDTSNLYTTGAISLVNRPEPLLAMDFGRNDASRLQPGFTLGSGTVNQSTYEQSAQGLTVRLAGQGFFNATSTNPASIEPEVRDFFRDYYYNNSTSPGEGILLQIEGVAPNIEYEITLWSYDPDNGNATPTVWSPWGNTTGESGTVINLREPHPTSLDSNSTTIRVITTSDTLEIFGTTTAGSGGTRLNGFELAAVPEPTTNCLAWTVVIMASWALHRR